MEVFEVVIALLLGGAALAAVARRIGAPYPALVALAGAALALIPGVPTLVLDPELALALFVAPVLVDAAFDASPRDLRTNWRAVTSLALGAVVLTVAVVAVVARLLVPGMPWAAAVALGAIVAPPDAAAATTVLKALRPPHRLLVILEGESLFNDASALLIYRLAVGAMLTGTLSGWTVVPMLLIVTVGSVVLALVLSRLTLAVSARITDVSTAVVVQFCSTFGVWILAEQLHLSGIITLVVYAMAASRRAAEVVPARIRIPAWAVWEVAVFVLNVLAFILVGFQLRSISERVTGAAGARYALVTAAVCAAVIVARMAWVTGAAAFSRWRCRPHPDGTPGPRDPVALSAGAAAVVGWCGMRGTVTLAAALALPTGAHGGAEFPYRDLIIVTAFGVVLGTLVLQGLTLRPLMLRLGLEDDGSVGHEVRLARVETLRAALAAAEACPEAETAALVRHRYALQLSRAEAAVSIPAGPVDHDGQDADEAVVRAATRAERRRLVALRADGTIGDAAFQRVEEELDWAELDWARVVQAGAREEE
ncbi:cation:proton antiporter [Longimicrobium terrae]|uniref:CPA1 family monovalent cation:H+ antiporter n=1 Tax=Longimicrobium terrae TaxID=1639882 RepID=A0A841H308_9BACT|nr:sodium:proton antiporter [Longimicrobium terrae]MBB4637803.1 CPA1 family monovalent cation:H+ antiporter [Longimicrobium terrae]MBB6072342.1 CPA1 family monovalent cation:H+ antiporter [Longimicrobium terrae]NNC31261.1 sodium:proton antiporter [Longimicrobium terrae]